jgi:hypothetical protein
LLASACHQSSAAVALCCPVVVPVMLLCGVERVVLYVVCCAFEAQHVVECAATEFKARISAVFPWECLFKM